jgi:hypothetical protein
MNRAFLTLSLLLLLAFPVSAQIPSDPSWTTRLWQVEPISSAEFESHPAFDRRNATIYFVRSSPAFRGWRILESMCRGGRWSAPQPPSFAGEGVEADPFVARGGRTLFFISSRKDDGVTGHGLDLWRVDRRLRSSAWGKPVRLPEPVNSAGNEWFPRLAADGWLYFGSDRRGGLGATDIYRARQVRGRWRVENLGEAVNSSGDEYEAEISSDGRGMILMADGDLYSVTYSNGRWGARTRLGPEVNSTEMEVGPLFSPSGRSFLFARDFGTARLPMGGSGELMLATSGNRDDWPPRCGRR